MGLMRILLVEDSELMADAIVRGLSLAGFAVDHVGSAERAEAALRVEHFDLAVVDIGLPGADGLSLVRALRAAGKSIPVLILTARDSLDDKIHAFDLGADDFLTKPFEQAELAARCKALVRRAAIAPHGTTAIGRLRIDFGGQQLRIGDVAVELTRREWLVFEALALNVGRIVPKDRLLQAAAGWEPELTVNAIEVYVSRLRVKFGDAAVIRAVRGLGYRLDAPA
jgi:DNA-binding response OmpR family regulator